MRPADQIEALRLAYASAAAWWSRQRYLLDIGRGDFDEEARAKAEMQDAFDAYQSARECAVTEEFAG